MSNQRLDECMKKHLDALDRNCSIHYMACEKSEVLHFWVNLCIIGVSTVLLALTFHEWPPAYEGYARYVTGAASVIITIAGSYQAFARPSEKAARHKIAAIRYGVLAKRLEVWLTGVDPKPADEFCCDLLNDWEEISSQAPLTKKTEHAKKPPADGPKPQSSA